MRFELLPGQRHDTAGVAPLIEGVEFDGLIADKAFDANWIVAELDKRGAKVVISQMPGRKAPLKVDRDMECAPGGGQIGRFELTSLAGLPEDGSHDEAPFTQRRVQAAGR